MITLQTTQVLVNMVPLKQLAERILPRKSILRMLVLSEPDYLPRQEALVKIEIFVKLLYQEQWSGQ